MTDQTDTKLQQSPAILPIEENQQGLEEIILLLRKRTGHDFLAYKKVRFIVALKDV